MSGPKHPVPRPTTTDPTAPADRTTFRGRLIGALRDLARIEGRVAYEADDMDDMNRAADRPPDNAGRRGDPAAGRQAPEGLGYTRDGG